MGNEQAHPSFTSSNSSRILPSEAELHSAEQTRGSNANDPTFSSLSSPRTIAAHQLAVNACAFSSNGLRVASASSDGSVKIWNRAGEALATWHIGRDRVTDCHLSPDDRRLVVASGSLCMLLDLTASGQSFGLFRGHVGARDHVVSCRFNHRGDQIASTSREKKIRLWDPRTSHSILSIKGHGFNFTSAEFHPDDHHLASGCTDRAVRVWDLRAYQSPLRELNGFETPRCQFSPSWPHLMCASSGSSDGWNVSVLEVATWTEVQVLPGHTDAVHGLAFADGGRCAITASWGCPLKVWDVQRSKKLCFLMGFDGDSWCSCAVHGESVAYGGADGTLRLWTVPFARLRTEVLPQHVLDQESLVEDREEQRRRPRRALPPLDLSNPHVWQQRQPRQPACLAAPAYSSLGEAGQGPRSFESLYSRGLETVSPVRERPKPNQMELFPITDLGSTSASHGLDPIAVAEIALDMGECVVCYDRPADTTLLPCRHMCLCALCARALAKSEANNRNHNSDKCPVCRQVISRAVANTSRLIQTLNLS